MVLTARRKSILPGGCQVDGWSGMAAPNRMGLEAILFFDSERKKSVDVPKPTASLPLCSGVAKNEKGG